MDLEILNFYTNALIQHRKAEKPDSEFLKKLAVIYMNDQIPTDVYEMILQIIKTDNKKESTEKVGRVKPTPKNTSSITEYLKKNTVYVEWSDGCHTTHRLAKTADILAGKKLYQHSATPTNDPCRGPVYTYKEIPTPNFDITSSTISTGSCSGGSTSSNGRC